MFRKRPPAQEPERRQAQAIWDEAFTELMGALEILYAVPGKQGRRDEEVKAEFVVVTGKFTPAMYGFEELVERQAHLELTRPLAAACRCLLDGLFNDDADQIEKGLATAKATLKLVFEPDT